MRRIGHRLTTSRREDTIDSQVWRERKYAEQEREQRDYYDEIEGGFE